MFTPQCIEFKGFMLIGTIFFFLEKRYKDSDIVGNSGKNSHIRTNTIMFLICASFCKT